MFEFASEIPLASDENKFYFGMAHDGHQTYLSSKDRQISILNDNCSLINLVYTYRSYHTICYDCTLKCFWAASSDRPGFLFCLSEKLEDLEQINLSVQNPELTAIDHLFYNFNEKQLYITMKNQIYTTDQTGNLRKLFEIKGDIEKLEGICAYNNYLLCLYSLQDERHISIHTISNGSLLEEQSLSAPFKVFSMTLIQDPLNPLSLCLRLLAVKQEDTPFLIDYKPNISFFTQYSTTHLTDENPIVSTSNIHMQQLCGNRAPNPFFPSGCKGGNNNGQPNSRNNSQNSSSPIPPASCCSNNCPYCCPNGSGNCHSDCNYRQSYADVIESIALTEASIAHILNAEGEKLQKAIACSRNVSELLRVNESVLKTITHSTHLEQMLYYKLEAILNTGCLDCCPPSHPCCRELNPLNENSDSHCQ